LWDCKAEGSNCPQGATVLRFNAVIYIIHNSLYTSRMPFLYMLVFWHGCSH
jgi:hypothetical protein